MTMRTDLYQGHDYYNMDELLTEEHKLIRDTARAWVKQEVSPIIEDAAERCEFPKHLLPGLGELLVAQLARVVGALGRVYFFQNT